MHFQLHTLVGLLAVASSLTLAGSLFLPMLAVAFFAPPDQFISGVGSMWSTSISVSIVIAGFLLPMILVPCFLSTGRGWLPPLIVAMLALVAFITMLFHDIFLILGEGSRFTVIALAAVGVVGLCTLLEAIVARRSAQAA
jgi:hypothetical protein